MTEVIVARSLMIGSVRELPADRSLREAMDVLLELQSEAKSPNVIGVIDSDGAFEGLLTARLLFRSLLTLWMPSKSVCDDEEQLEQELLDVVAERAEMAVHDALTRGLPTVAPDDRLLDLIETVCDKRLEFLPVVDANRLCGVVPVTAIFQGAASLALTPEHEGIQLDRDGSSGGGSGGG